MKCLRLSVACLLMLASTSSFAVVAFFTETADKVRFEQYTSGPLALYRLPTQGAAVFLVDVAASWLLPEGQK